jgi:hypothetical protein
MTITILYRLDPNCILIGSWVWLAYISSAFYFLREHRRLRSLFLSRSLSLICHRTHILGIGFNTSSQIDLEALVTRDSDVALLLLAEHI